MLKMVSGTGIGVIIEEAMERASSSVKSPEITAVPPAIGSLKTGADRISPSRMMASGRPLPVRISCSLLSS